MANTGEGKTGGGKKPPELTNEVELPTGEVHFDLDAKTRDEIRGCLRGGKLSIDVKNARIGILRGRPVLAAWTWD
jgi:hypothetical protein